MFCLSPIRGVRLTWKHFPFSPVALPFCIAIRAHGLLLVPLDAELLKGSSMLLLFAHKALVARCVRRLFPSWSPFELVWMGLKRWQHREGMLPG